MKKRFVSIGGAVLAALMLAAGACGDDSGDNAQDTAGALEEFSNDFNATTDIGQTSDDVTDSLKDNCGEMNTNVDSDDLDEFCEALGEAIDDDDQAAFSNLKAAWPALEQRVRADIAADIQDAASEDDDDDNPLEGGDPGNDDTDDNDVDDDDIENPLDSE